LPVFNYRSKDARNGNDAPRDGIDFSNWANDDLKTLISLQAKYATLEN
jgi:hypothetical protein